MNTVILVVTRAVPELDGAYWHAALSSLDAPAALARGENPQSCDFCRTQFSRANSPSSKRIVPWTMRNYLGVKALSKTEAQVTEEFCLPISELGGLKQGHMTTLEMAP